MSRFEVYETVKGETRIVKSGIRRENGAINERDIASMQLHDRFLRWTESGGRVVGPVDHETDPRAVVVTYVDADATLTSIFGYRREGATDEDPDLTGPLLASLYALGIEPNI